MLAPWANKSRVVAEPIDAGLISQPISIRLQFFWGFLFHTASFSIATLALAWRIKDSKTTFTVRIKPILPHSPKKTQIPPLPPKNLLQFPFPTTRL